MSLISLVFLRVACLIATVEPKAKYDEKPQQKYVADHKNAASLRGNGDERPAKEKKTGEKEKEGHRFALPSIANFFHGSLLLLRQRSRGEILYSSE